MEQAGASARSEAGPLRGDPVDVRVVASRQFEEMLQWGGARDPLTGLRNRRALNERLQKPCAGGRALAMVDVDDFKSVNDAYGHAAGDAALRELAARLAAGVPAGSEVFRFGGDEFVVLSHSSVGALAGALEQIKESLGAGQILFSAGVVDVKDDEEVEASLRLADATMYRAKSLGGARVVCHDEDTEAFIDRRRDAFARLARVTEENRQLRSERNLDPTTGISSRRAFDRRTEITDANPDGTTWAALFIDIDQFHDYNHRHGDLAGDRALRAVAQALSVAVRTGDSLTGVHPPEVFRKGGEEFVAIAAVPGRDQAVALAHRLSHAVVALQLPHGAPGRPYVTVSIGVAMTEPGTSLTDVCETAARRAYWLKENDHRGEVRADDGDEDVGPDQT